MIKAQQVNASDPGNGLQDFVTRIQPAHRGKIRFQNLTLQNGKEGFRIHGEAGQVVLSGSSTAAKTAAYGWYLKYVNNSHLSWGGDQLAGGLALPDQPIEQRTPYRYRFAYNYCTLSYTMGFWGWERWEREIDFMAANGYTHALVTAGLEKVWRETLRELNYPEEKITAFIANPGFAAWWHMGNLEGHGGPMTDGLIEGEAALGRQIAMRMKELGITPTLQGFVGLLPNDIGEHLPSLKLVPQGKWVTGFQRPIVLDPTTPAFQRIAAIWYKHLHEVYGGPSAAYGGDLFHEGGKVEDIDLTEAARAVQSAMQKASPGSTWVMQSWQSKPVPEFVAGSDPQHTFILQLSRNMKDGNNGRQLRTYQGRPWLWAELANFGANHGLYGGNPLMARLPSHLLDPAKERGNMAGLALLSEGIEINPFYYDIFFDATWRTEDIDLEAWIPEYAHRRYGVQDENAVEALRILNRSVYSPDRIQEGTIESILCAKPNRNAMKASSWSSTRIYYDYLDVLAAAESLIKAAPVAGHLATYRYDLVDVTRQLMSDLARPTLVAAMDAYDFQNQEAFKQYGSLYLELIKDTETLLASDSHWLLGTWLEMAKAKGNTPEEKRLMEEAARRQITVWSNASDSLDDYAHRQWAGLMSDYYLPRWTNFFADHAKTLREKDKTPANWYREVQMERDLAWVTQTNSYPTAAVGDSVEIAENLIRKYAPIARHLSQLEPPTEGLPWKISQWNEELVFNVNEFITDPGTYVFIVQYERGRSAIKIHSVELYEGDRKVAEDVHEGWTGWENRDHVYRITLDELRTNLDDYLIKVKVTAVSSVDSAGTLKIKKQP